MISVTSSVIYPGCCCGMRALTCTTLPRTPLGGCTLSVAETSACEWTLHWWHPEHEGGKKKKKSGSAIEIYSPKALQLSAACNQQSFFLHNNNLSRLLIASHQWQLDISFLRMHSWAGENPRQTAQQTGCMFGCWREKKDFTNPQNPSVPVRQPVSERLYNPNTVTLVGSCSWMWPALLQLWAVCLLERFSGIKGECTDKSGGKKKINTASPLFWLR